VSGTDVQMDATDRTLLNLIQSEFPVSARPYRDIAGSLDLTETEVFERVERLRARGIIRRLGGVFDSRRLGYVSTLVAMKVPHAAIDEVAGVLNGYNGITHNYLRDDVYNIWFTLVCPGEQELRGTIDQIKRETGISDLIELPAERTFKIRAVFALDSGEETDRGY